MLGASTFAEHAISDQTILLAGVADISGVASTTNVGVGIMSGIATMDGNFTATTDGIFITGSVNAELSSNFIQTTEDIKLVNFTDVTMSSAFTQTADGINILIPIVSTDLNFTKTSSGDILYENINAGATEENFTTITPSGTESWTTITPSGTESWTEIQ